MKRSTHRLLFGGIALVVSSCAMIHPSLSLYFASSAECVNLRIKRHVNRSARHRSSPSSPRVCLFGIFIRCWLVVCTVYCAMKGARRRIRRLSVPRLLLFMIAHVWCVTCVSFSSLSPFLYPFGWTFRVSTASGESLAKYLTCDRAQLRRDSETPNKRSGIGKDTVHYEIPPGNQRTETPPFTNAMNRASFNAPPAIIESSLIFV